MKNDRMTKQKLQDVAKKEFMEKGFLQASLRNICKEAGVTTGALYFFFKDKEDLFAHLVDEPLKRITEVMQKHYHQENENAAKGKFSLSGNIDFTDDIDASNDIIHYIYQYYDEVQLLLTKSQGTKYEHIVDDFVMTTEQHYRKLMNMIADQMGITRKEDFLIHWLAHMNVDVFIHIMLHAKDEETAKKEMNEIMKYLISGFFALLEK